MFHAMGLGELAIRHRQAADAVGAAEAGVIDDAGLIGKAAGRGEYKRHRQPGNRGDR